MKKKYIQPNVKIVSLESNDILSCSCGCKSADPTHYGCYNCPNCKDHDNQSSHNCNTNQDDEEYTNDLSW